MNPDQNTPIESLEVWLSKKPYWEQYVWKINFEKDSLSDADIEQCYKYLCQFLRLAPPAPAGPKPPISFKGELISVQEAGHSATKMRMLEVGKFENVNAISADCSIKFGPNLTLIYGGNGSGKSGISRLFCNACFSRGEREVLPNVKDGNVTGEPAKASFVITDDSGAEPTTIDYILGSDFEELKRYSVFDAASVQIHLDESNNVNFTPAQMKIFDKVADTISALERKLTSDKGKRRKDNPFGSMFIVENEVSETSAFCRSINWQTAEADLLKHATFDDEADTNKCVELQKQIDAKKKLDIPKKKLQLATDRQNLDALKTSLQNVADYFTVQKRDEINKLIGEVVAKKAIVKNLSVQSFDDGILKTIGSGEWKELITAAKVLFDNEKEASDGKEPIHCVLCHQELTEKEQTLFQRYWKFLESKAESEFSVLVKQQSSLLQELRLAKTTYPKFLATDAGVKILNDEETEYLTKLKLDFASMLNVLDDWISKIGKLKGVSCDTIPSITFETIDNLISAKTAEETKLLDPAGDIAKLNRQLISLKHKKAVTAVKDRALEYLAYLRWVARADVVNFAGVKMTTTKKRTEVFLSGVAKSYKDVFNNELSELGSEFDLVMHTSGDQGNTVKEYRLDFAEGYNPSQILSEGEQNVCSLADFLTEAQLDQNNCGIVFDDPVTSLDHERKDKIAERLVREAGKRQVVIFTHDIVFMGQLVKHSERNRIPVIAHWIRKVAGIPGCVENNASPKLANLASLKNDSQDAVKDYATIGPKEQEKAVGVAFDYLRSACEALVEEVLFARAIQRYDDHIKVGNLEEVVFDQTSALKIVELHGRLSEICLAHNISNLKRENLPGIEELKKIRKEFEQLEGELRVLRKAVIKAKDARKDSRVGNVAGW